MIHGRSSRRTIMSAGAGSGSSGPTTPLDIFPGAVMAYSYRKLRAAYAGTAMQARRDSDNVLQDFGFQANGDWDIPSYHTFIGAGTAHTSIWYDQSGNSNHQAQATAGLQCIPHAPDYPANNVTGTQGTGPANVFYAAPSAASNIGIWGSGGFAALVFEISAGGPEQNFFSKGTNPNGWMVFAYPVTSGFPYNLYLLWVAPTTNASSQMTNNITAGRHVATIAWNSSTPTVGAVMTLDGVAGTVVKVNPGGALSSETGAVETMNENVLNANINGLNGYVYECIAWKTQPSAPVQTALINNMRTYYGTP